MKSLKESLFDDDLVTRDIKFEDLIELEEVYCPSFNHQYRNLDNVLFKIYLAPTKYETVDRIIKKLQLSYIKPPKDPWKIDNIKYGGWLLFWYLEKILLQCSNEKEIEDKFEKFIDEIYRSNTDLNRTVNDEYDIKLDKVDVKVIDGLGDMKNLPQIVAVKLFIDIDGQRDFLYVTMRFREKD